MKKITGLFLCTMIVAALLSCGGVSYKKTKGGMPYKVFSKGNGQPIDTGSLIKLNLRRLLNDSLLVDTYDKLSFYFPINQYKAPYDISEIWFDLKEGDSIVTIQLIDTFMRRDPGGVPPIFKKGDRLITHFKIEKIFKNDSASWADQQAQMEDLRKREVEEVGAYLKKKNINAIKTKSGAYVEILEPGAGIDIDSGITASTLYKGTSFSGKVFDSSYDSAFGHPGPTPFKIGMAGQPGGLTKGFDEAMMELKKGSKARFYIPSMLAYGPQPPSPDIKQFEHLIFEVQIVDAKPTVADKAQLPASGHGPGDGHQH